MINKWNQKLVFSVMAFFILFLASSAYSEMPIGPAGILDPPAASQVQRAQIHPEPGLDIVRRWNKIALEADAIDHALFGEQLGPTRASRAMAIVHIALFDAVNAIFGGFQSYTGMAPAVPGTSFQAAVAQAAHDTLAALYPSQSATFDGLLAADLSTIPPDPKAKGIALGQMAASAILALRTNDGSQIPEPPAEAFESNEPGRWRRDPISNNPIALGAFWGNVTPFVLNSGDQFRLPPPPPLGSFEYARAFNEAKKLGGVGLPITPTLRSLEQTLIGIYWSYDGTPFIGTPPRLYNQIAVRIANKAGAGAVRLARLLALLNVSMADAAIAAWDSKYFHLYWRPVTGIREADQDGNRLTIKDQNFTPLGAQASNLPNTPDFTPPFPAYPSGHATFGGAIFTVLRNFYRSDRIAFSFVSDELNGKTLDFAPPFPPNFPSEPPDDTGRVRPLIPRSFASLSSAESENGQSRIYLGVHWQFDSTGGIKQGRQVANFVSSNAFQPLH